MTKLVLESTPNLQGLRKGNFDWVVTEMHPAAADATDAAVQPLTVLRVQHPDTEDTVAILELPFYSLPLSSNFMAYQFVTDFKPPFLSELIPKSADVRVELGKLFRRKDYPKLTKENAHKVHLSYNCQIVVSQMYEGVLFAFWYDEQLKKLHGSPVYNSRREKQLKQKAMRSIIARDYEIGLIFFNADDPRFKLAIKTFEGWFGTQFYGWH
ncbi:hypothetical protein H4R34_001430 [Dimargaris verticillata]|uniref:Uncharacterized protein n=1 Tax=Dimargaris verticillata TaxID=2761393 RepID=A0A9W8B5H9_9FUNG|nr:hypothetical protein H4R34_001430 [Dimargaris verticillata]